MQFFPTHRCTIDDSFSINGMQVIYLENDLLRIGVLAGRGADIFEVFYKPVGINLLLRLDKPIYNPSAVFPQRRDTLNQFEDYYYGGWQTVLPNSAPMNYKGAFLGQHGEVWQVPWSYAIEERSDERVVVRLWTSPLRFPIRVEKTIELRVGASAFSVTESVRNESEIDLDIMWGQHIAFGLPWLQAGALIETSAQKFTAEPSMPDPRRFSAGQDFKWPMGFSKENQQINASVIPSAGKEPYSELLYLKAFKDKAWYRITDSDQKVGFTLRWDDSVFHCLWLWQERYGVKGAPWWGNTYAVALEPWSCRWSPDPHTQMANNEWIKIEGKDCIETSLIAEISGDLHD